jgi:hypothetical protein
MKNEIFSNIFNLSLSSASISERTKKLEELWNNLENEELLFNMAKTDEVASHIGWLLQKTNLNYSVHWQNECLAVEKRINCLMTILDEIAEHFGNSNIKVVALKNSGITKGIYPIFACSPMGDIDLLVSPKDFYIAHNILISELKFTFKFRSELEDENIEEAFKNGGTEYFKTVNGVRVWLELQWRPIAGRWIQPHNEPNGEELIERSLQVNNSKVRILSPEDNLLQVALHTAKHSYVRAPGFRLHSDVDRIVRFQDVTWDKFLNNVKILNLKTSVYFSLYFAKYLLDTPIPSTVLTELAPCWFKRKVILLFVNNASFYNQNKKKFTRVGYVFFNLFLYDNFIEVIRAVFPPFETLNLKYKIKYKYLVPFYYFKRLFNLAFRRAKL